MILCSCKGWLDICDILYVECATTLSTPGHKTSDRESMWLPSALSRAPSLILRVKLLSSLQNKRPIGTSGFYSTAYFMTTDPEGVLSLLSFCPHPILIDMLHVKLFLALVLSCAFCVVAPPVLDQLQTASVAGLIGDTPVPSHNTVDEFLGMLERPTSTIPVLDLPFSPLDSLEDHLIISGSPRTLNPDASYEQQTIWQELAHHLLDVPRKRTKRGKEPISAEEALYRERRRMASYRYFYKNRHDPEFRARTKLNKQRYNAKVKAQKQSLQENLNAAGIAISHSERRGRTSGKASSTK